MELNKYIDHTVLKATANKEDIRKLCEENIIFIAYVLMDVM